MPLDIFYKLYARVTVCLFSKFPPGFTSRNNRSALYYSEFVNEAILELLHSGRVMELNRPPDVVNPLSVSIQPNGKKRLILDLRYINNFLIKHEVKYKDWKIALSYSKMVLL